MLALQQKNRNTFSITNLLIWMLCGIVFLSSSIAKAQVYQDFFNSDILENPAWWGNKDCFKLTSSTAIPTDMRPALQLQGDTSQSKVYLATNVNLSSYDTVVWDFWAKLSFTPSVNNHARFYLLSDNKDLTQKLSAYFVTLGENQKTVSLYQQTPDSLQMLIEGFPIKKTTNVVRVKVKHSIHEGWKLYLDTLGEKEFILQGQYQGPCPQYLYAGIYCSYTKSNAEKMYFDDIHIRSIFHDTIKPFVEKVEIELPNKLVVHFSEEINIQTAGNDANYYIDGGMGEAMFAEVHGQAVRLYFADFEQESSYTLHVRGVKDLVGNEMEPYTYPFSFYQIHPQDLLINEVLFNPHSGGSQFVEIYNNKKVAVSLKNICLATFDKTKEKVKTMVSLPEGYTLASKDYCIITTDLEKVTQFYTVPYPEKVVLVKSLPSYAKSEGIVILAAKQDSTIIDQFNYSEKMHFLLLKEKIGVSLERRSLEKPTQEVSNWQSASQTSGWATPTYENSQYTEVPFTNEILTLSPELFTPDNDGKDDLLNIYYQFEKAGLMMNIRIYNTKGVLVKNLQQNALLGLNGSFTWDGLNDQERKCDMGFYIIAAEIIDLEEGRTQIFKRIVVLGGK